MMQVFVRERFNLAQWRPNYPSTSCSINPPSQYFSMVTCSSSC
jgi:hypothetical protein